ncbi:hypothetical protein [Polynucleobacter sp. MG-Unter2-18]|uniref:hypothetical protein n=1 Tax=Polynucleobacter sp. MG-Unter2-18 TaxID=2081052 RepID=UPI001BFE304B|nr:hypothetical protein [Polynucleobacter sp. MG-Unter2-18]
MIRSLAHFCPSAKIYVLCMDAQTKNILERLDLPFVNCIRLAEVENEDLLRVKAERGVAEYCWTLSSCFTWYVMQNYPEIEFLTYVDADMLFYSDVQPLFDEIGNASIAIIEHRFTPRLQHREVNGRFCVEWVSFRRDEQGLACLLCWREQCIEWCYYRLEDGKMGDQKYLDEWPDRYSRCHILQHPGAGIAPWNYEQYEFFSSPDGTILVQGAALIFYHFHQFQLLGNGKYDRLSAFYTSHCAEPAAVYEVYERALDNCLAAVRSVEPGFKAGFKTVGSVKSRRLIQRYVPMWAKELARKFLRY